jgi:hypothetical protein
VIVDVVAGEEFSVALTGIRFVFARELFWLLISESLHSSTILNCEIDQKWVMFILGVEAKSVSWVMVRESR